MFKLSKSKSTDNVGKLIGGEDQVKWAYQTLVGPGIKKDLSHLIDLLGHKEAAEVITQVLSDKSRVKAIAKDYRENDVDYHALPEPIRALLGFRFFCAGLTAQAHGIVDSISRTENLDDRALFELYFMMDTALLSGSMAHRVSNNMDLLKLMNQILLEMKTTPMVEPKRREGTSQEYLDMLERVTRFFPSNRLESDSELMEHIARYPHIISELSGEPLQRFISFIQCDVKSRATLIKAMVGNQNTAALKHVDAFNIYLETALLLNKNSDPFDVGTTLECLRMFGDSFLSGRQDIKDVNGVTVYFTTLGARTYSILQWPDSAQKLDILVELTRLVSKEFTPATNLSSPPEEKIAALSPLLDLKDTNNGNPGDLTQALRAYAARAMARLEVTQEKIADLITDDRSAFLIGHLVQSDLLQKTDNESLLSWKLESELGL